MSGAGDTDNGSFAIDGDALKTAASFDFESRSSYSIRVQTDDGNGGTLQKVLIIAVTNVNEAPTIASLGAQDDERRHRARAHRADPRRSRWRARCAYFDRDFEQCRARAGRGHRLWR